MKKISKAQRTINTKKIKFNSYIILIFLLFSISFVLATNNADIFDDEITIKVYNTSKQDYEGTSLTSFNIEFISQKQPQYNNQIFTFSVNLSSQNIGYESESFGYIIPFITDTPENISFYQKWLDCEVYSGKLDTGYTRCVLDLDEYKGENATTNKEALDACNLQTQQKDLEITSKTTEILDLEEKEKNTENSKWFFGIAGILLGVLGLLIYQVKIGKTNVKERSDNEFNKNNAG